jgi:hypothetical protein
MPRLASRLDILRVPVWMAAAYALLQTDADPDLWGHVRFGLDTLHTHQLSSVDPYSYTSDLPWMNHEWLSELGMGAAYALAGAVGLVVLKVVLAVITFSVLAYSIRLAPNTWRWPSAFLAIVGMVPIETTLRPHLWTLLFLTVLCRILNEAPRYRYWLPLMFVFWANVHGGWIVGFGVLALWSFVELFEPVGERPSHWILVGVPAACLAATLCNPYGWELWAFLARTVRLSRADISEWQPVWRETRGPLVIWVATLVWIALAVLSARRVPKKIVGVLAMLAYASFRVSRLLPLFVPAAVILLLPHVSAPRDTARPPWPKGRTVLDVVFACIGTLVLLWPPASVACINIRGSWIPDLPTGNSLAAARPRGRLVTWFDWGEYAIWHFGPELKVSMDGRRETVYSESALNRQVAIASGEPAALNDLETSRPEYVWLPLARSKRTRDWLRTHAYRIDMETADSFIATRDDLPRIQDIATASSGCFPGGIR